MPIPTYIQSQARAAGKEGVIKLFLFLRDHARGKANAMKKEDLIKMVFADNPVDERALRLMLETLVAQGYVVCSSTRGYWYADSLDDGMEAIAEIRSRIQALRERADKLEKNLIEQYGPQERLF